MEVPRALDGRQRSLSPDSRRLAPAARIRILKLIANFHSGGTERQVTRLASKLDSTRFDLHLGCLRSSGELLSELRHLRVPRPEFSIGSFCSPRTLLQSLRLIRYLRRTRIEVVHSYGLYPNVFMVPAARLAGVRTVIASIRRHSDLLSPWQRALQKLVCRFADCVVVNATALRNALVAKGYRAKNILVIPDGIAPGKLSARRTGAEIRAELGLPLQAPLVIVASRLHATRGIDYFLEAAARVARHRPDVRFIIAGDGDNRVLLERYASHIGVAPNIVFTRFRNDLPDLLTHASVSVVPSLSEGLSHSLLEAMASGIAVIATNAGGNPEIVENEKSGLLVPPRDAAALADSMIRLLDDPSLAARLGYAGRQRVLDVFSMDRSVDAIERLYQRLVRKGELG